MLRGSILYVQRATKGLRLVIDNDAEVYAIDDAEWERLVRMLAETGKYDEIRGAHLGSYTMMDNIDAKRELDVISKGG